MKKYLLLIMTIILSSRILAQMTSSFQSFVVTNTELANIYVEIDNELLLNSRDSCSGYKLTTDNGSIEITQDCYFKIIPDHVGLCNINVVNESNGEIVGQSRFVVVNLPKPEIRINGKSNGETKKKILSAQIGVTAKIYSLNREIKYDVVSFSVIIIRKNKVLFSGKNFGGKFNDQIKKGLQTIKEGDEVIFYNSIYKRFNGQVDEMQPSAFSVKN